MKPAGVRLTPEARDYIREKGGALTLRSAPRHGCCGGRVELVKAEAERPRSEAGFRHVSLDGVTLHVEEGLLEELEGPIEVGLDRLMGLRSLYVTGTSSRM
jgi:hypothetical protein